MLTQNTYSQKLSEPQIIFNPSKKTCLISYDLQIVDENGDLVAVDKKVNATFNNEGITVVVSKNQRAGEQLQPLERNKPKTTSTQDKGLYDSLVFSPNDLSGVEAIRDTYIIPAL